MLDYEKLEECRQMARNNYYAQMIYSNDVNALDLVKIVRCKDCKHRPKDYRKEFNEMTSFGLDFPDDYCPCQCEDGWYNWYPPDDWFCANGKRRDENAAD